MRLFLILLFALLVACGSGSTSAPPGPPEPPVEDGLTEIYWTAVDTLTDGTSATPQGYKVSCRDLNGKVASVDAGPVHKYLLRDVIKEPGTWDCVVLPYGAEARGVAPQIPVKVHFDGRSFTKG